MSERDREGIRGLEETHYHINPSTSTPVQTTSQPADLVLASGGPHVLEVTVTLGQTVEGVIALATGADEAAESVGVVLAGVAAVLVNLADGDLDRGVVVGLDDAVGGAALAGHVAVEEGPRLTSNNPNIQRHSRIPIPRCPGPS